MSVENTKAFLKKIAEDAALKERLVGKEPAEVLAVAKELGLECTWEEMEAIGKKTEMSPEELDEIAGGINMDAAIKHLVKHAHSEWP